MESIYLNMASFKKNWEVPIFFVLIMKYAKFYKSIRPMAFS